jgi:hypothetical protein
MDHLFQIKDLNKRLPGLATLSSFEKLEKHRNIKIVSLGGQYWPDLFNNETKLNRIINQIDPWMIQHIQDFYDSYKLELPFKFEHKTNHLCRKLFYFNKCDYAVLTWKNEILFKLRGKKESENCSIFSVAREILNPSGQTIKDLSFRLDYTEEYIQGASQYLMQRRTDPYAILPGYNVFKNTSFRFTNSYMNVVDVKTHKLLKSKKGHKDWAGRFCVEHESEPSNLNSTEKLLTLPQLMDVIQNEKNQFQDQMNNQFNGKAKKKKK